MVLCDFCEKMSLARDEKSSPNNFPTMLTDIFSFFSRFSINVRSFLMEFSLSSSFGHLRAWSVILIICFLRVGFPILGEISFLLTFYRKRFCAFQGSLNAEFNCFAQIGSAGVYSVVFFWLTCDPSQHGRVLIFIENEYLAISAIPLISGESRSRFLLNFIDLVRIFVIFHAQLFSFLPFE